MPLSTATTATRRRFVGCVAEACGLGARAAHSPWHFVARTEASLAHANALVHAALQAGFDQIRRDGQFVRTWEHRRKRPTRHLLLQPVG